MGDPGTGSGGINPSEKARRLENRSPSASWQPSGPLWDPPKSILIVMLSAVGDAVQVLPLVTALRRTFPSTHISWVLQPGPLSLVRGHPAVDEFVLFQRGADGRTLRSLASAIKGIHSATGSLRKLAARQPGGRFDLLLNLQVYLKAGLLTALVPAEIKLGFDRLRARDLNGFFTTHRIPPHPKRFGHIQDQYFEFLQHVGVNPEPLEYGLCLTEEERNDQERFFSSFDHRACALVLGSSDPRKDWDPVGFAEVASRLQKEYGLQPMLVGGTSPQEEERAHHVLENANGKVVDARGGGLRRLLWLLAGSALVISPDTGPLHMARAMEVPVVGLYGFTNPGRSGPYRRYTELVVDGYARFPGEEYEVNMKRRPGGMGRITPDGVMEKVELALRVGNE